ncbi:hypothetical protein QM480_00090 [Flectobacillus sp. DC10W]|jgi:hypothetical protein|uniref:Lipoprotein n=1 Tax=Flectobacillus longus TaxID=2984207 RepID=A0ABT6YGI0_9BACT|nr:hypothetical protein [Flectobacillus longus]MDI9862701.1 hypothetical protein [Flectobacillus longus]
MKNFLTTILASILLTGCINVAKISDFSLTSSSINFDNLSKEFKQTKTPFWTLKTSNEYYFEKETNTDETQLIEAIRNGLHSYYYAVAVISTENKCVIGKRGMMANEWSSITAVYYKISQNKTQVYLNTKITQDITGGWRENRAMKVGQWIEQTIK